MDQVLQECAWVDGTQVPQETVPDFCHFLLGRNKVWKGPLINTNGSIKHLFIGLGG